MILSAGLTPAWQQIMVFEAFRNGEVNRAREAVWCASGKVFNAGIAVHHLGGPSLTLAPVGGPAAEPIAIELAGLGVPCEFVPTVTATRVCTTILDLSGPTITELVENGRALSDGEVEGFRAAYRGHAAKADVVILIGSLPVGAPDSLYRELVADVAARAVLDFRGPGLLSVLDLEPLVVKPNREELERTVGRSLERDEDLWTAMRSLNQAGAHWVVVTQGEQAVWVSSLNEVFCLRPPHVAAVVNPIGSGDAMAAGIAWSLRADRSIVDAVRWGMAAAAQNVRQLLPCRIDPAALAGVAREITVERMD